MKKSFSKYNNKIFIFGLTLLLINYLAININTILTEKYLFLLIPIIVQTTLILLISTFNKYTKLAIQIWSITGMLSGLMSLMSLFIKLFLANIQISPDKFIQLIDNIIYNGLITGLLCFILATKTIQIIGQDTNIKK